MKDVIEDGVVPPTTDRGAKLLLSPCLINDPMSSMFEARPHVIS